VGRAVPALQAHPDLRESRRTRSPCDEVAAPPYDCAVSRYASRAPRPASSGAHELGVERRARTQDRIALADPQPIKASEYYDKPPGGSN